MVLLLVRFGIHHQWQNFKFDSSQPSLDLQTLVFCSGQIYYELLTEREKRGLTNVALVRLEQIAPFAFDRVAFNCDKYKNAEVVWAQQEPK